MLEIKKVLLEEHEKEGLVRDHSEGHYNVMTTEEIKSHLTELGELKALDNTREESLALLKSRERTPREGCSGFSGEGSHLHNGQMQGHN